MSQNETISAMIDEMATQIALGHTHFCIGIHTHADGQLEEEWINWKDALTRLAASVPASATLRASSEETR